MKLQQGVEMGFDAPYKTSTDTFKFVISQLRVSVNRKK